MEKKLKKMIMNLKKNYHFNAKNLQKIGPI